MTTSQELIEFAKDDWDWFVKSRWWIKPITVFILGWACVYLICALCVFIWDKGTNYDNE